MAETTANCKLSTPLHYQLNMNVDMEEQDYTTAEVEEDKEDINGAIGVT